MILVQHLVKTQEHCGLLAAMTYSSPWNLYNVLSCLEKSLLNISSMTDAVKITTLTFITFKSG